MPSCSSNPRPCIETIQVITIGGLSPKGNLLDVNLKPSGTMDISSYFKALDDAVNLLVKVWYSWSSKVLLLAPSNSHSTTSRCSWREVFRSIVNQECIFLTGLADAEQEYEDWKGAVCQILGEAEVQRIFQTSLFNVDEVCFVKEWYITGVTYIKLWYFCMSQIPQLWQV